MFYLFPCRSTGQVDWHAFYILEIHYVIAIEEPRLVFCVNTSWHAWWDTKNQSTMTGNLKVPAEVDPDNIQEVTADQLKGDKRLSMTHAWQSTVGY